MFTPFQTNGIFHTATYNTVSMVDCAHLGVTDHKQLLFSFSEDRFVLNSADPEAEQTLMKYHIMWHFIWVFTVCQCAHLGLSVDLYI